MPAHDFPTRSWRTLWSIVLGPTIWAFHFLFCYILAAVVCAKGGTAVDFSTVRILVAVATVAALAGIGYAGLQGYHQWRVEHDLVQDQPTDVDRRQFLGQASMMLCGLSGVATVYVALAAVFIGSCT